MFCPSIQGEYIYDCVFCDTNLDKNDPERCYLRNAAIAMQSFGFDMLTAKRTPASDTDKILRLLNNIDNNTGSDQTNSSNIEALLDDIKELLTKD